MFVCSGREVFVCSGREVFVCSGREVFVEKSRSDFSAIFRCLPPRASRTNFEK
ncbi:hypothetical protein [Methanimicrococcus hongohii]|uniref:hypothetical protein n=1 Tax=Methanimicrococcus hongohii TaxID=3028295 RepID=UPI002931CFC6|nr:hypothetical protein [Methanimicrococcus sp. Hf6]